MWKETGKQNIIATGRIIELYEKEFDFDGKLRLFEYARRPPGVRLLFQNKDTILLTKEYRDEHKAFDYRLPGGKVFDRIEDMKSYSGNILEAARNAAHIEAKEECGIVFDTGSLELFHISHCGATIEWDLYYFLVRDFTFSGEQDLGEGEYITYDWYTREDITNLVKAGMISEDRTISILWKFFLKNE